MEQAVEELLRRIAREHASAPLQEMKRLPLTHGGQKIKQNVHLFLSVQSHGREAAHLKDRDAGDSVVCKLHLPGVGGDLFPLHKKADPGLRPDA